MTEETVQTTTPTQVPTQKESNPYLIPGAIIIAGLVVAGAIFAKGDAAPAAVGNTLEPKVLPVTEEDHVFGSRDADIFLIEYSDYQCPFCERFHGTVKSLIEEYDGKVAWVYRHFPLEGMHPEARPSAIAAECAAELGGDAAFWAFTDRIFENQQNMSEELYRTIARELGIDDAAFTSCLTSGKYDARVDRDLVNGEEIGAQGTPYNVILTKKGDTINFSGALPKDKVKVFLERAVKSL